MQLDGEWQRSGVGKMRGKPWNVHVLKPPVMVSRNAASVPLPFSQEHPRHPASVFQKSFEIGSFRPVLLGDITFLLSAAEKTPLKVRGKLILFVSMAVVWGEDSKPTSTGCLQVSEQSLS